MNLRKTVLLVLMLPVFWIQEASAIQRFPKPEFESGYVQPATQLPLPRGEMMIWLDVAVLLLALSLATWLVLKKRSRLGVFWLSLFSLAYFGFYRQGCVCSVGSIQNVALALFNGDNVVPLTVLLFFLLPLVFTLLFGRTFCAAVCPFGTFQDLVAFRPVRLGSWLNAFFGMIPYLYLGLAILFAATATDFIICRYDPFVGIFRLNATFGMFIFSGILLFSGVFIARPYCRFLCPYGVLLNWMSRFSWRHMKITPAACIQCRLCENACPYDAIDYPQERKDTGDHRRQIRRMVFLSLMLPVLAGCGALLGHLLSPAFAGVNSKVRLERMVTDAALLKANPEPPEITAFKSSGVSTAQLHMETEQIRGRFHTGSMVYGAFIGLVFGLTLMRLLRTPYRSDYVANRGACFSCTRCMDYCPVEK